MIPIRDNIPTRIKPIITISIIFVNISVYLFQTFGLNIIERQNVFKYYGLIPKEVYLSLYGNYELIPYNLMTLFTSMFLHGSFMHLGGNMLYLWIFGNNIEDSMGHKRFVLFYLLSGTMAAIFQLFYDPQSEIPMIGASGAVSGILGSYLLLFPYARIKTIIFIFIFIKIVELPAVILLTIWFFMQVLLSHTDGVAWYAHIGGFVSGILTIKIFTTRRTPKRRFT